MKKKMICIVITGMFLLTMFAGINSVTGEIKTNKKPVETQDSIGGKILTKNPFLSSCDVSGTLKKSYNGLHVTILNFEEVTIISRTGGGSFTGDDIKIFACFISGVEYNKGTGDFSASIFIVVVLSGENNDNNPPKTPTISGPGSLYLGKPGSFTFRSTDLEGDKIYYIIDWGYSACGSSVETKGPYNSGVSKTFFHSWSGSSNSETPPNMVEVIAKARDIRGAESGWSEPHTVLLFLP